MQDKYARSIRFDAEINRKLEAVCKSFGVKPNAYILNVLGKSIMNDYQSTNSENSFTKMTDLLKTFQDSAEFGEPLNLK
jgi:hypothetical protein